MFFDARAALAELQADPAPRAHPVEPPARNRETSTRLAEIAEKAARHSPEPAPSPNAASPYGQGCGGLQRTWTGKVVSLEEWRRLSEWDRHGSTGKMWNGITKHWEPAT